MFTDRTSTQTATVRKPIRYRGNAGNAGRAYTAWTQGLAAAVGDVERWLGAAGTEN